jgi:AcrR family transcriptional regulator
MATETYDKILFTARNLFMQQGYTATSMRQVAEAAGIGKATIYHHFPDKQSIVMSLVRNNITRMDETLQHVRSVDDPRLRIQVATQDSVEFLFVAADIMQIVRREVPGVRDQMQTGFYNFFQEYITLLTDAIQRGKDQGIFRQVNPAEAARVLMTMIQGTFAMAYLINERAQSPQQAAAILLDVFFNGIDVR